MRWKDLSMHFQEKDPRVTAPMISWSIILVILSIIFILVTIQTVIIEYFPDNIALMVIILTCYMAFVCLLIAGIIWLLWRHTTGKPIKMIAGAARKVASGDFRTQIPQKKGKRKKNEIDVLIEDFNKMIKELNGNEMLKNDFISNVSHEMKTPLSIIQSYAKALKDGHTSEEQRKIYIDTIIDASEKMNTMITNNLKLCKLENQQIFPAPKTYQLGEQLRHSALGFMDRWQEKGISFEIDVVDTCVCYDETLMEIVWNNLIGNAVKYTERGGSIALTSKIEGDYVYVSVRDTGCGMEEETRKRVFEKFYQGDTSHASEGNGLGLALSKKIIDIAGGEIEVESTPGQGSVFTVRLRI